MSGAKPTVAEAPPAKETKIELGEIGRDVAATDGGAAAEIEKLRTAAAEASDRALRATAELENFRKRTKREMDDERKYAVTNVLRDLLPVIDNLERALAAGEKGEQGGLLEGVKLVAQQLMTVLERYHCTKIAALGQPFDPNLHEAILHQPSAEVPAGQVVLVTQEGYRLHDRVLRPAQVIVSSGPATTS